MQPILRVAESKEQRAAIVSRKGDPLLEPGPGLLGDRGSGPFREGSEVAVASEAIDDVEDCDADLPVENVVQDFESVGALGGISGEDAASGCRDLSAPWSGSLSWDRDRSAGTADARIRADDLLDGVLEARAATIDLEPEPVGGVADDDDLPGRYDVVRAMRSTGLRGEVLPQGTSVGCARPPVRRSFLGHGLLGHTRSPVGAT